LASDFPSKLKACLVLNSLGRISWASKCIWRLNQ